jgi:hypothetical protein
VERQAALAALLTSAAGPEDALGFDAAALRRTRAVLEHKRVDEVMPLLPRLSAHGETARALAFAALRGEVRNDGLSGISDALRVADAAAADPGLAGPARLDRLELRARFAVRARSGPRPRLGPFAGKERLPDGSAVWALKGPGRGARVRFFNRGGAG